MFRRCSFLAAALLSLTTAIRAGEIGFIEDFSLATDRTAALKQLIPGTEDYYYYHALHYLSLEQYDKVDELLKPWTTRYQYTPRVLEIENRRALLNYGKDPQRALALIRQRLNLQFNHQRELLNQKPNLPTKLDPALLAPAKLTQAAFAQFPNTIQGFEDAALDWLVSAELNPEQRRHLLSRLQRPDHAGLVKLIVADLNHVNSGGFGQFEIHRRLLLAQLDECLKLKPDLRNQANFVNAYISKLRPSDDSNWRQDRKALGEYLDRLWAFVSTLEPVHNSLKAHVLYQRLVLDRQQGKYNAERFLEYLKLPKHASYVEPKFMALPERQQFAANLQQDYGPVTMLPVIGDDEPLVRSYLLHFFVEAEGYQVYSPYINDLYLKQTFAEAKIVNGLGDGEKWFAMLPPEKYQALRERIDLDFAFTSRTDFGADEAVTIDLDVKNVGTLLVKVFQINAQNFYRQNLKEVGSEINLDGLVANEEKSYTYKEPPLRRVRRHFEFPALKERGVYVIDFIGNGKASRALVRKGKLTYLVRSSVAGQVFTVLHEANQRAAQPTLWLAGNLYTSEKDGTITLPYSNQPGRQPIVLSAGGFASLAHFQQETETYQLAAGMYVDREELLSRRTAKLIIRPSLKLGGTAITRKVLEDVRLVIASTDLEGVSTSKEVSDVKLFDDRDTTYEFQVPQRLAAIHFMLKAKVQNHSQNQKQDLAAQQSFAVNEIDRTDKTEDLHFVHAADGYAIDLLGKTGETKADRPVQVVLKLRDFTQVQNVSLQSDADGRVLLGTLPGVASITATSPQGVAHTWNLRRDEHTYPQSINAEAGQVVEVPYMGTSDKPLRSELSLLELRGPQFVVDKFEALSIQAGMLRIAELPPGDYSLLLKATGETMHLRLTEGARQNGYILGGYRKLEVRNPKPLQMEKVEVTDTLVRVKLQNASPLARVHVLATRFEPAFSAYGNLSIIRAAEPYYLTVPRSESQYIAGRNIGDEYRYIIDRKYARKFPGNMLERPSLLLNPWAIRSTETAQQEAQAGEAFGKVAAPAAAAGDRAHDRGGVAAGQADFADLDFLADSSIVLANLTPDKDGVVEIKREALGSHQELVFVAVDPENTASRIVPLPATKADYLDLRLAKGLDAKQHYTQQKRITVVPAGGTFKIADVTSSKFEAYDSLAKVYGLYATLNGDANLIEFGFLRTWPTLKPDEKRALYLKYASHELHFILYKKDPEFFRAAIRPYLANKKDKQFVDRWLLEEDLKEYLKPWNFEQLNTLERILLGQRIAGEQEQTARLVQDQFNLLPPDVDRFNKLFQTALKGSALDTSSAFGSVLFGAQTVTRRMLVRGEAKEEALYLAVPTDEATPPPAPEAPAPAAAKPAQNRARKAPAPEELKASVAGKRDSSEKRLAERFSRQKAKDSNAEMDDDAVSVEFLESDVDRLARVQQFYRKLDKTMEWVESNYFKLPIEQQTAALITTNAFWNDYAGHDPATPFISKNVADASRNLPEMLAALALTDLPFTASEHKTEFKAAEMTLTPGSPLVVYHEEILPAAKVAEHTPILVSENFFRHGDRFRQVNNEQLDKFVTEEFLIDVVYGCHIVVTNPSSSRKKVDVLLQVPAGALPVAGGQYTRSVHLDLEPYHTQTLEYHFYFPASGKYAHYPVQVAAGDEVLAFAAPFTFNVVKQLTNVDKESWDYISQHGTSEQVTEFLGKQNILAVNLDRIAWRMHDKDFFNSVVALLSTRHVYNQTLWSYGVLHNQAPAIRQFLQFAGEFVNQCGEWLDSPLLTINPVARRSYEQMDYKPLVNARVGQLGRKREILNDRFLAQYQRLLKILSYRRQLDQDELMSVTNYLLLQDRVAEALEFFGKVNAEQLATRLQYDYFAAYVHFYQAEPQLAKAIAAKYADYPVERWRTAFANIVNQADEINRPGVQVADAEDRTQLQTKEASTAPALELVIEDKRVKLNYQNLSEVRVNYYLMDLELLFSNNPFVQGDSRQFANILPNKTQLVKLPAKGSMHEFALPDELASSNVLVEIVGAGVTQSQAYYSNALKVQVTENYGQVRVTHGKDAAPLAKVYVKVYARMKDGSVKFYKDGYTDLRGRFDYTSLNTNELDFVERFSLLILSEEHGSVVREAKPPKR